MSTKIIMKPVTFGKLIRKARRDLEISQAEVAKEIGMTESHICNMELGKFTNPKMSTLHKLSDFYGISFDELCIAANRIPEDVYYKIPKYPELLEVIRKHKE